MYSLVMLAALTPGGDVTPISGGYGCGMVAGCAGYSGYSGCVGYSGCSGAYSGCYGCTGARHGGLFHGRGGLFGHRRSCHGCEGYNCNGWNCFGSFAGGSCAGWGGGCAAWGGGSCAGWGGGYSGWLGGTGVGGGFAYVGTAYQSGVLQGSPFSCHGGCYGGYYGGGTTWGPPVGLPATSLSPYTTSYGGGPAILYRPYTEVNPAPAVIVPATDAKVTDPKDPKAVPPPVTDPKDPKGTGANLKFRLPAAAKLYVDGQPTNLTGAERVFTTPPLAPGQKFYYDVKAVFPTDGDPVVEERRVIVEAGATLTESFPNLLAAEARITGVAAQK